MSKNKENARSRAKKTAKARNTDNEVINLLKFRKRHAYA